MSYEIRIGAAPGKLTASLTRLCNALAEKFELENTAFSNNADELGHVWEFEKPKAE